ncbi:MAG: hypothetical protein RLZZ210_218 [Pseudomonadota bacterium]|jgi:ParB family chromosome partitioning protein
MPKHLNKTPAKTAKSDKVTKVAESDINQKQKGTKGLGKGLGALLAGIDTFSFDENNNLNNTENQEFKPEQAIHHDINTSLSKLVNILCASVVANPHQPRKHFDDESMQELASSIKNQGVLQPIVVKWDSDKQNYQIIAGERRWRAAQMVGLQSIPAVIRDLSDSEQALIAIIENIQRAELTSIEEAQALYRLKQEFDLTHEQIAEQLGKSRSHITNILRLLNLAQPVQEMLSNKQIDMGHARALLTQDSAQQIVLAHMVIQKNMSVREIEQYIKSHANFYNQENSEEKSEHKKLFTDNKTIDKDLENLQNDLEIALGAMVQIKPHTKSGVQSGKGSIVIKYESLDGLDVILSRILPNS